MLTIFHGHIFWWIVVGLAAGALAKAIMPGSRKEPTGCITTMLLGIGGSLLTGFVMRFFFHDRGLGGLIPSICGATLGAMVLIMIFRNSWS